MTAACCDKAYYCPTAGEDECGEHGGFSVCCSRPDLHTPRHTDPEHFGMFGYCPGPWPCALCDALGADKRTPCRSSRSQQAPHNNGGVS